MSHPGGLGGRPRAWARLGATTTQPLDVLVVGGGITGPASPPTRRRAPARRARRALRLCVGNLEQVVEAGARRAALSRAEGVRPRAGSVGRARAPRPPRPAPGRGAPLRHPCVRPLAARQVRSRDLGLRRAGEFQEHVDAPLRRRRHGKDPGAGTCGGGESVGRLRGRYVYFDSKTDDVRLVMEVLVQVVCLKAVVCNYAALRDIDLGEKGCRVLVEDTLTGDLIEVAARRVIVAGGVWNDRIELLGNRGAAPRLRPSKGIHLAFRREDVALADAASFIPDAARRKMLFLIPWHDVVVVGTNDSDYEGDLDHPTVTAEERTYLLDALNAALGLSLSESDVVGAWAGLRPLARSERNATVDLSRAHAVYELAPGVTGITGGKLTTYRRMAQDAVDRIAGDFEHCGRSRTRWIKLGCGDLDALRSAVMRRAGKVGVSNAAAQHLVRCYGDRALAVLEVAAETGLTRPLVEGRAPIGAEAVYCTRSEMAVQLADLLARRTRLSLTEAGAGIAEGALGLEILAEELAWSSHEAGRQHSAHRSEVEFERGLPLPQKALA